MDMQAALDGMRAALEATYPVPESPPSPHSYVYASAHRACLRRIVLEMTAPGDKCQFDAETRARFRRGNDRERDLVVALTRAGQVSDPPFTVEAGQERFEMRGRGSTGLGVVIVGKIDGRLAFGRGGSRIPFEVKSWHPNLADRIETATDLLNSPFTTGALDQILAYLLGLSEPWGVLVLDRGGLPRLVPIILDEHLDRAEKLWTDAERACEHATLGTLPEFCQDQTECRRCPFFGGGCQPPIERTGAQIVTDPEVEADLTRWGETRDAARDHEALDKKLKALFRGMASALCGAWIVSGKGSMRTAYDVPDDVKKQYATKHEAWTVTIERADGGDVKA